jgi:hypothetical protein
VGELIKTPRPGLAYHGVKAHVSNCGKEKHSEGLSLR